MKTLRPLLPLVFVLAVLAPLATAAGTPADTEITNQASATYNDSSGEAQTTTSNQVVTIIQQVHQFSIAPNGTLASPGQSKVVLSGADAYFNYVVANTGNGADTIALSTLQDATDGFDFRSATLYTDGNCNGTIDTGEASASSITLDADARACVILAAGTPGGLGTGAIANIDVQGTYPNSGSDTGNWARATITDAATLDARMSLSPSGVVPVGQALTLSINGSNVGASAAYGVDASTYTGAGTGIVITSSLPSDVTFAGGLAGSAGAGTFTGIYFNGVSWSTTPPADLGTVTRVGAVITGSGAFFPQTASYALSFNASVKPGVSAGTLITLDPAQVRYSADGIASITTSTNSASVSVSSSYGVAVGPFRDAAAGSSGATSMHGEWSVTVPVADRQRIDVLATPVYTGDTVLFKHTLQNAGNASDSFTLAVSGAPSTWACSFRHADATTPISAAVGPFASGATFDFVLTCGVPQANSNARSLPVPLTVTAASVTSGTTTDATTDEVPEVLAGYAVDVTSGGTSGIAPQTLTPGAGFRIPFEVTNTGGNSDVYSLQSTLPAGWSVTLHDDTDCDGAPESTMVTRSSRLQPAARACFVAVGTVPGTAAPSSTSVVTLTALSTTDTTVTDGVSGTYSVDTVASISFNPERSGTLTTPGAITYTLEVRNNGNAAASVGIPAVPSSYGWTYQLSTDNNTWSSALTAFSVPAASGTPVYVRVIVPAGQPIGRIETLVFTATGTFTKADGTTTATSSDTAAVTSTIVGGDLTLGKSVRTCSDAACVTVTDATGGAAEPGDYLQYEVVAKNIGTADITEVIVMDPLPNYTSFVSASGSSTATYPNGTAAVVLFSGDGIAWTADPSTVGMSAGGALYVGIDTEIDGANSISATDALGPGETITITFTVRVQ